jgi:drug/metabolite transporter (DMT)-like permease
LTDARSLGRGAAAALAVALAVNIAWGATPVLTRIAVEDLEPLVVAVLRTVLAGLVAVPILAAMRTSLPVVTRARGLLLVSAVTGFVAFPVLFTIGQERTSATHAAIILAALPVFTGAYAALVSRRRPSRRWLVGCSVALVGEAGVVAIRSGGGDADPTLAGDLIVLVSALVVALGYVAGALLGQQGYRSVSTTFWGVAIGAALVAPLGLGLLAADGVPSADAEAWAAVVFLALVTSIVGYVGWYWALARGGIARVATIQFVQPLSGIALAALVLGERITAPLGLAAAVVLAGVWIVLTEGRAAAARAGRAARGRAMRPPASSGSRSPRDP